MTEPTGQCPVCRRRFALTDKGLVRIHRYGRLEATCLGSGQPPREVAA